MFPSFTQFSKKNKTEPLPSVIPNKKNKWLPLAIVSIGYSIFGIIMVYSASMYNAQVLYNDTFYYLKKQIIGFLLGLIALISLMFFDYRKLLKYKWLPIGLFCFSLILLALVFIPGVGRSSYGATRWIGIGPITIQPSEIAKYTYIIFCSAYIAKNPQRVKGFIGILPILLSGGVTCLLIILEPNMSVTMCVAGLMIAMVFLSGTKLKNFFFILVPVIVAVPLLIISEPYRLERLSAYLDPWASPQEEGYQLIQSLYGLGNGGFFGVGLFNSTQKFRFLPFAESDFILSIIGEELGFFGILILFIVAFYIIVKGFSIAKHCDNLFGYLLACGITLVFAIQTLLNALVVSGTIPPTGLPLPFISAGNTSLIVSMASIGLLCSIERHNQDKKII